MADVRKGEIKVRLAKGINVNKRRRRKVIETCLKRYYHRIFLVKKYEISPNTR